MEKYFTKNLHYHTLTSESSSKNQQDTVPKNHGSGKKMPVCVPARRHGMIFLIIIALAVEGCSPECVFIPLGHLGPFETELLVFQADFLSNRALRTGTTLVIADAHEALPGYTEEFFTSL